MLVHDRAPGVLAAAMKQRGLGVTELELTADAGPALRSLRARGAHVTMAGEGRGAVVASRLALEASFGIERVVALDGRFDDDCRLAGFVPYLILSAHPEPAQSSHRFARCLERTVAKDVHRHHVTSFEQNDVVDLVESFVRRAAPPGGLDSQWAVDDAWGANAPLSSAPLDADPLRHRKPVDPALRAHVAAVVADLAPWPMETYDAIDLDAWLAARPALGSGEWLMTENARGERLVFSRAELRRRHAELVVGLDDEPNLFRLFVTYNVYRTYSWQPEPATPHRLFFRPVGAFLHFPDGSPPSATHAEFALTPASFRVTAVDPWAAARGADVLVNDQGCVQCHGFGTSNARAHHLRAADGAVAEAFALPLAAYPADVMHRFLFDQDRVAEEFGVGPLHVEPATATDLEHRLARK